MSKITFKKILSIALLATITALLGLTNASADNSKIQAKDFWVKATKGNLNMTSVFGNLQNNSGKDLKLMSANSDVAKQAQLHTTVNGIMQEQKGGFEIKNDTTFAFKPGGNHVMLMGLKHDLKPGETVKLTFSFSDNSKISVTAVVKQYAGANENYKV